MRSSMPDSETGRYSFNAVADGHRVRSRVAPKCECQLSVVMAALE
jgi:hypothetical protein